MRFRILLAVFTIAIFASNTSAQCPASVSISGITVSPATCPSNGSATINTNAGANATYQLTSGPATGGYPTSDQDANVFNSLPPGNYAVTVKCKENLNISATANFTIANNYTPLSLTATASGVCTNYVGGGTITATATGGSGILQYAVLLGTDPAVPDDQFTYGDNNVFSVTTNGTYQVRVKDACGTFITRQVEILTTMPKIVISSLILGSYQGVVPEECNKTKWTLYFKDAVTGAPVGINGNVKYKLEVWPSTTGCPTTFPTEPPSSVVELTPSSSQPQILEPASANAFSWRITTGCGEVTTGCITHPSYKTTVNPRLFRGCSTTDALSANFQSNSSATPYTISVTTYDASNNVVATNSVTQNSTVVTGITSGHHYSYTWMDACGTTITNTFSPETSVPTLSAILYRNICTSVLGTGLVTLNTALGDIPGLGTLPFTSWTLTSNTTGAVYNTTGFNINVIHFQNVPPGSYTLNIPTDQGCSTNIPITVVANSGAPLSNFDLNGTVTQTCSGTGSITSQVTSNATSTVTYNLHNKLNNALIATNSTGIFSNLPAGNYYVKAVLSTCYGGTPLFSTKDFSILPAGANPAIVSKIGIICDNNATGIASFSFTGTAPYVLEMKKNTETSYTTIDAAAPNEKVVTGLTPKSIYDVRITDKCGNSNTTTVTVSALTEIKKESTVSPCNGQPYTLALEDIVGATYSWTKDGGAQISTSNKIEFPSYTSSDNGTYVCTIKLSDCIVRTETIQLNSAYCGSPLSVNFGSLSAVMTGKILNVNWTSETELNNVLFKIEASKDGINFIKIGEVNSKALDGNSDKTINYEFNLAISQVTGIMAIISGIFLFSFSFVKRRRFSVMAVALVLLISGIAACSKNKDVLLAETKSDIFIRIATVDKEGHIAYSKIVKVVKQ